MITADLNTERGMPTSVDAERSILGAIMLDNLAYNEAAETLRGSDFYLDSHRRVYASIARLIERGGNADIVTLIEELKSSKELEAVGGYSYVSSLTDGLPRRPSIAQYISIVREKSMLRQLMHSCSATMARAQEPGATAEECSELVQSGLLGIAAQSTSQARWLKQILPDVISEMDKLRSRPNCLIGFTTGIDELDIATTGIRRGEYWVIGAAPSRGKTVLATQIGIENAKSFRDSGKKEAVALFSYEMKDGELVKRILSGETRVSATDIRDPHDLTGKRWDEFLEDTAELSDAPLLIEDLGQVAISTLTAKAKLMIRRHNVGLIIVDYLQKIDGPGREDRQRVSAASNALRLLAKTENVAVVTLSQLRRPTNENDFPSLIELKETGDIEADAHTVLLIHRPKNEDHSWSGSDSIFIAKQRSGITGPQPVVLHEHKLRFLPRTQVRQP